MSVHSLKKYNHCDTVTSQHPACMYLSLAEMRKNMFLMDDDFDSFNLIHDCLITLRSNLAQTTTALLTLLCRNLLIWNRWNPFEHYVFNTWNVHLTSYLLFITVVYSISWLEQVNRRSPMMYLQRLDVDFKGPHSALKFKSRSGIPHVASPWVYVCSRSK